MSGLNGGPFTGADGLYAPASRYGNFGDPYNFYPYSYGNFNGYQQQVDPYGYVNNTRPVAYYKLGGGSNGARCARVTGRRGERDSVVTEP